MQATPPTAPRLSVVMPVFNAGVYLRAAIESVLNQSFSAFELIVVNDGSTDGSGQIAQELASRDPRMRYLEQANQGASLARNRGHALAHGEYLAVADADDIQLPRRFAQQVEFLDRHPTVAICGSWIETTGARPGVVCRYPTADDALRCQLLFDCPLAHPSAMMRTAELARHQLVYRPEFKVAHDYDLWVRAAPHCAFANLPEVLVHYREHEGQLTNRHRCDFVVAETRRVWRLQLERLGLAPSEEELALHERLSFWPARLTPQDVEAAEGWLRRLQAANVTRAVLPAETLAATLGRRWHWVCSQTAWGGPAIYRRFCSSPLARAARLTPIEQARFWVKCVLRRGLRPQDRPSPAS
jgi:glycosyltransferase involved in cell wall biosynthesis